ncbi:RapZ C-terminal domain-containing protein [Actinokineospora enzanensis]|uniref:RapZ C-terminal domain-containing protein n=1 Tax=Actinokineospora enzanensis TaxID=155975 RepID=UPI000379E560|nr:RNase adapter RapZ [Actinokineospora enzanensis]
MNGLRVVRVISCGRNHLRRIPVPDWDAADVQLVLRGVLPNPFHEPELRDLSGLDAPVQAFIVKQGEWSGLRDDVMEQVRTLLDAGRPVVTVGVKCSGGHDRSVGAAELLAAEFRTWDRVDSFTRHPHLYCRTPWVPQDARRGR